MSEIRIVVAIDFGTTYSGFAYAHRSKQNQITAHSDWQEYKGRFKTPTVLKYDESFKLTSWGVPALAEKPNKKKKTPDVKPVERFKLHLGQMKDKPHLPDKLDYKTAITDYLREMGQVIKNTLNTTWQKIDFFKQVLIIMTIPAEFDNQAMTIMRECAYDAGIINEKGSKNLKFTTEPEAAAVYCLKKRKEYNIDVGSSFMIVDCGGGTVDLTTRKLREDDKLDETTEREGDFCGGSFVDEEFLKFIGEKVGESALKQVKEKHYSQLQYMVQDFCRRVKIPFNGESKNFPEMDLKKLCPILQQYVKESKLDEMEEIEWIVELTYDDVKAMFDPVIERIINLIRKQLDKSNDDISAILLVGGFSESKYLLKRVKQEFNDKVPTISVPTQPIIAVVKGAVQYGLEQEIVKTRVLKWTYGTDVAKKWQKGDPPHRRRSDGRIIKFTTLAKRGEQVPVDKKIVRNYAAPSATQKILGLDIYVTKKDNATYCNEPGVELLDSWNIKIPEENKSKENRSFSFTLTFGSVEIEAIAQSKSGEKFENSFELDI